MCVRSPMRHPDIPSLRCAAATPRWPTRRCSRTTAALGFTTLSLLPLHFRADEARLQRRA
jgi:glycogen operon protein